MIQWAVVYGFQWERQEEAGKMRLDQLESADCSVLWTVFLRESAREKKGKGGGSSTIWAECIIKHLPPTCEWLQLSSEREGGSEQVDALAGREGGSVWSRSNLPADGWRGERWRADRYYARQAPGTSAPTSTGSDADEQVASLTWQSSHSTPPPSHDPSSLEALQILCIFLCSVQRYLLW